MCVKCVSLERLTRCGVERCSTVGNGTEHAAAARMPLLKEEGFACGKMVTDFPFSLIISMVTPTWSRLSPSPSPQMLAPGSTDGCPVPQQPGRTSDAPCGWWPHTGAPPRHPAGGGASTDGSYPPKHLFSCILGDTNLFSCVCCDPWMSRTEIKVRRIKSLSILFQLWCVRGTWVKKKKNQFNQGNR